MINSIETKNYQSHKHSKLEFDPGVNVIIGSTDSGKTTILRSLRKATWNKPMGEAFRSNWGGETSIVVKTDQNTVAWYKDKEAVYKLDGTVFKAFGTEVPIEIVKALNLNEINLQQQLDAPFLLTSTPGEVARHFNKIANLDQIDISTSKIKSAIREIEQTIKADEKLLEQYKIQLEEFASLDKFEIELEVLEQMQADLIIKVNQKRKLIDLITSAKEVEQEIIEASELLPAEKQVNKILGLYKELNKTESNAKALESIILDIEEVEGLIEKHTVIIKAEKHVSQLLNLYNKKKEEGKQKENLETLINQIISINRKAKDSQEDLKTLQKEFQDNFPDVCPLCEDIIRS